LALALPASFAPHSQPEVVERVKKKKPPRALQTLPSCDALALRNLRFPLPQPLHASALQAALQPFPKPRSPSLCTQQRSPQATARHTPSISLGDWVLSSFMCQRRSARSRALCTSRSGTTASLMKVRGVGAAFTLARSASMLSIPASWSRSTPKSAREALRTSWDWRRDDAVVITRPRACCRECQRRVGCRRIAHCENDRC